MTTAEATKPAAQKFEPHPLLDRYSPLLGTIEVYAPAHPHAEWMQHPWCIKTENGFEGKDSPGLLYVVKAEHWREAFDHIALVQYNAAWHA